MWDGIRNHKIEAKHENPASQVVSYKLSDEELEAYRKNDNKKPLQPKPHVKNFHKTGRVRKDDEKVGKELSKEEYLNLKEDGLKDLEIIEHCQKEGILMHKNKLYSLKTKWGLKGNLPRVKSSSSEPKQKKPLNKVVPENKVVNIDVYNRLVQDYEIVRKRANNLDELVSKKDEELKEANDTIKQLQSEKCPGECQNTNTVAEDGQWLIEENERLKKANKELRENGLSTLSEYAKVKRQNEYLQDRVDCLLKYEEKYFVTSQALKLHL